MSKSPRFITLTKELKKLRQQFLPKKPKPTDEYTERQLTFTIAYRVLAHAEIESYLEDRAWEATLRAKKNWDEQGRASRTLISLLAFSGETMELPPSTLTPRRGSSSIPTERIQIDEKIKSSVNCFKKSIDQNHGVKEANLLTLLLPIGLKIEDIDSQLIATLNTFGESRGLVAHSSAASQKRTRQPPDPFNELATIEQIKAELLVIDNLINRL